MDRRKRIWLRSCSLFCHVALCLKCPIPTRCWEMPQSLRHGPQRVNYGVLTSLPHLPPPAHFSPAALSSTLWLRKIRLPLSLNFHIFGRQKGVGRQGARKEHLSSFPSPALPGTRQPQQGWRAAGAHMN